LIFSFLFSVCMRVCLSCFSIIRPFLFPFAPPFFSISSWPSNSTRICAVSSNLNTTIVHSRMSIIESEVLLHSDLFRRYVLFVPKFSLPPALSSHRHRRAKRAAAAAASVFSRAGSRVCMTDSGAIESDLERFQKTFSRSPTYKAALSPREHRAVRHETSRTTIETRRTYTHTYVCTIATKRTKAVRNDEERQKENGMEGEGG